MKYLFVCEGNADRSPTAARICREMANERGLELEVQSSGLKVEGGRQLTREMAESADKIFVMEDYMVREVVQDYCQAEEKIVCLNVRDDYDTAYPQERERLEQIFREKLEYYLKK